MSMKGQIIIQMTDPTPEKFSEWKQMEGQLIEMAHQRGVILEEAIYDDEKYTKTLIMFLENKENYLKIVVKLGRELDNYAQKRGIKTEILELKDFEDDVTNLNMFKANKLIDEAKQSIERLKDL